MQYNLKFNRKFSNPNYSPKVPFSSVEYKSELNISLECNYSEINYFQNLIGVLRWIVELGRIIIAYEVSSLSKFLGRPKTGHVYKALHIFKYLEAHIDNKKSFDPLYQEIRNDIDPQMLMHKMREIYVDTF